ncbi:MAG: tetratricopeptide repeat protein, partial [Thermoplasmata archaeon]|nr:tetratricopeptide repeat protein [Thermoplasmata archaeon]
VLDEFPEEHNVLLHKARALYATNSHVQAAMVLDGLTSSPSQNNPDVWELKGLNLYRLHHEIDALEAFERAIELDRRPSALKLACRLLQKKGRLQRALEHIEDALQIDPDDRQAWKMKSSVLGELGLHREAGEALRNSAGRM